MHMQPFLNHFHAMAASSDPKGFRDGKKRPSFLAAMATFIGFHQKKLVIRRGPFLVGPKILKL